MGLYRIIGFIMGIHFKRVKVYSNLFDLLNWKDMIWILVQFFTVLRISLLLKKYVIFLHINKVMFPIKKINNTFNFLYDVNFKRQKRPRYLRMCVRFS